METLYRKVAVSERLPDADKRFLAYSEDFSGAFEFDMMVYDSEKEAFFYFPSDVHADDPEYWMEEIITEQLEGDKNKLLNVLQKIYTNHDCFLALSSYGYGTEIEKVLEEIPDPTAQLKGDKEELLEALDNSRKVIEWYMENTMPESDNHTDFFNIGMNQRTEIESLIQKHKQ